MDHKKHDKYTNNYVKDYSRERNSANRTDPVKREYNDKMFGSSNAKTNQAVHEYDSSEYEEQVTLKDQRVQDSSDRERRRSSARRSSQGRKTSSWGRGDYREI